MLKAVLFDLDDTLIDWSRRTEDWTVSQRRYLEGVFSYITRDIHPLSDLDDFCAMVQELSRDLWMQSERGLRAPHFGTTLRDALERSGVPPTLINIEACLQALKWQAAAGVQPFSDVPEILPTLLGNNIRIGIITNSSLPMWLRDRELEELGLLSFFEDCRVSAADVGYLKPHPAVFEAALQCMDIKAHEAVFVGDNPEADVAGAQGIGMRAVLRIASRTPPLISGLIIPDGAINSLYELLPLLDRWYPNWRQTQSETKQTQEKLA